MGRSPILIIVVRSIGLHPQRASTDSGGNAGAEDETSMTVANDLAVRRALESAGVEFIDENGGGAGVRLIKRPQRRG
jgi:hypothetical protein